MWTNDEINYFENKTNELIIWMFRNPDNAAYAINKTLRDVYLKAKEVKPSPSAGEVK